MGGCGPVAGNTPRVSESCWTFFLTNVSMETVNMKLYILFEFTSQKGNFTYFHFHGCHALYSTNLLSFMDMYSPTSRSLWFTLVVNVLNTDGLFGHGCYCCLRSELAFSFIDVSIFACFFSLLKWMGWRIGGLPNVSHISLSGARISDLFQPASLAFETFRKKHSLIILAGEKHEQQISTMSTA